MKKQHLKLDNKKNPFIKRFFDKYFKEIYLFNNLEYPRFEEIF